MNHVMMRCKVIDFGRWMAEFNADESWRRSVGEQDYHVYRDTDDPSMVTVIMGWDHMDNGQNFINSPTLRRKNQDGGVVGEPTYFLLKDI